LEKIRSCLQSIDSAVVGLEREGKDMARRHMTVVVMPLDHLIAELEGHSVFSGRSTLVYSSCVFSGRVLELAFCSLVYSFQRFFWPFAFFIFVYASSFALVVPQMALVLPAPLPSSCLPLLILPAQARVIRRPSRSSCAPSLTNVAPGLWAMLSSGCWAVLQSVLHSS
jgi:hypothetical protein